MKKVDLTGKRFGKLTVISIAGGSRNGSKLWECLCDCGNKKLVTTRHLNRNGVKNSVVRSCGCLNTNTMIGNKNPHYKGYGVISGSYINRHIKKSAKRRSVNGKTIEVSIDAKYLNELWDKQKGRCAYTKEKLTLPIKWDDKDYTASVDRIDSLKGYIPGNVQFVLRSINIMKNQFTHAYFINMCEKVFINK